MKRRTFLVGSGAVVAGTGALVGTGALSQSRATRSVTVDVVGDGAAYLRLGQGSGDPGDFVTRSDGVVRIDIGPVSNGTTTPGSGANDGGVTALRDILRVENRGTRTVELSQSLPADAGIALITGYDGPSSIARLGETGSTPSLAVGESTEVGLAIDAGYGTSEIPGTIGSGGSLELAIVAEAV